MWPFRQDSTSNLFYIKEIEEQVTVMINEAIEKGEVQTDEIDDFYEDTLIRARDAAAKPVVKQLHRTAKSMHRNRQKIRNGFERRLAKRWRRAFDLYEIVLEDAKEIGDHYVHRFGRECTESNDLVFYVETRLHARCCQIGYEVLALLRAGLGDGAHARWRSMHELVVVAHFISKHGQDVAERYLLHDTIESWKMAKNDKELGDTSITEDEFSCLDLEVSRLCERFGQNFKSQYGWAADAIRKRKPNFTEIEESLEMEAFRPMYKIASHNVHAGSKGITFRLGYFGDQYLLAGPSNAGLSEAGASACWSLVQITQALLSDKTTFMGLVLVEILRVLAEEADNAFAEVEGQIQKLAEEEFSERQL